MQVYIGSDHAGYATKESLKEYLLELGHSVEDMGAFSHDENDDYPDFVTPVAEAVADNADAIGIIFGGSGEGEAMCANRVRGVRATAYYGGNEEIVRLGREHNDANVLSLGARFMSVAEATEAVDLFIHTDFSGDERHARRIAKF